MRALVVASVLAVLPALAQADGFYTSDLGDAGGPADCTQRAQRSLSAYVSEPRNAGATIATGAWSVDAYHLQPGNVSVQIACPYRDGHVDVALITAFSTGPEADRIAAIDAIVQRWNAPGQNGGAPAQGGASK